MLRRDPAFPLPFSASRRGGASRGASESRGVDSPGSQVCAWADGASLRRGGKFELLILVGIRGLSLRARAAWARPSTGAGARRDCVCVAVPWHSQRPRLHPRVSCRTLPDQAIHLDRLARPPASLLRVLARAKPVLN